MCAVEPSQKAFFSSTNPQHLHSTGAFSLPFAWTPVAYLDPWEPGRQIGQTGAITLFARGITQGSRKSRHLPKAIELPAGGSGGGFLALAPN